MKTVAHRSQELILRSQVKLQNRIANSLANLRHREDGSLSVELVGIVVVVGGIAIALITAGPGWATAIVGKINEIINSVVGGGA